MKKIVFSFLVLHNLIVFGQNPLLNNETGAGFLYLKSDSTIYGADIKFEQHLFKKSYFDMDTLRIESNRVKFCQIGTNYYANVTKRKRSPEFDPRLLEGRVNFFIPSDNDLSSGYYQKYSNGHYSELKEVSKKNLRQDFVDDPESMIHIKKYLLYHEASTPVDLLGLICEAGAIIALQHRNNFAFYSLGTLGIASYYETKRLNKKSFIHLIEAMEIYNTP